jgi:hypothetical protein
MEKIKKPVLNTQDALIKYLLQSKREVLDQMKNDFDSPKIQDAIKSLREKKKEKSI